MKGKPTAWSEEALQCLRERFPHTWNKELAKYFNIGHRTIIRKARELGLEKAPDFRDSIDFTQLRKGIAPPNKGKKAKDYMTPEGLEKMKISQFKKGHVPASKTDPEVCKKAWSTRREKGESFVKKSAKKAWRTRRKKIKETLLLRFEKESAQKVKNQNDRLKSLKEEFKKH